MSKETLFVRILDTAGDGTGTKNAIGDYSSTATDFYIQPPAGVEFELSHLIFSIRDTGCSAEKYGGITALTNGVQILFERSGETLRDLTDGLPIQANADFARYAHNIDLFEWGAGDQLFSVDWEMHGPDEHFHLFGNRSDKLIVRLNDNFAGLVSQHFSVQGVSRQG